MQIFSFPKYIQSQLIKLINVGSMNMFIHLASEFGHLPISY